MKPSDFLTEAAKDPFRKYPHIEDLVLKQGSHGGLHAIERLRDMTAVGGSLEVKWDGMPVVYWGRDEQGNFSMIPKNAWAYLKDGKTETSSGAPTVMRSPNDVTAFVLGTGDANPNDKKRVKFANQFASLWPYFEKISPKQGYLEGGLLFYPGTKLNGKTAMPVLNPETNNYDFQPNISGFHIPADSVLGKKIAKSKVMVAATGYYPTMGSSDEQRFPNAESLSVPGVIVQGTTYVQEPVPVDTTGLDSLDAFVKKNAKLIDNYLAPKPGLSNPGGELYTYFNQHLRTEGLLADFPNWANANLSTKKAQTLLSDTKGLKATLGAVEGIAKEKIRLKRQADTVSHGGIKQTKPEGYAQAHPGRKFQYDMPGQFVKVVDQSDWSPKKSVVNEAQGGKSAVLGWGRGMGHTGHDALVKAVIHQAETTGATPYFVVSRSFGKDDPIPPETKVKMYQKKFPKYAKMFSLPTAEAPTLNDVLANLATKGITDVTLVVGADQKNAFGYLTRPDKSGVPPYKNFGLDSLTVMSRQDTKAPGSDKSKPDYHEGPRATPMREILLDPNKTEQEQFAVWRKAMSPSLDDSEVLDMMNTAKQNLVQFHTPKPRRKASKIKEHIAKMRPLLKEATVEQQYKMLKLMKEAYQQIDKGVAEGLNEDVGGNYLYHATGADGLKGMLSSGSIRSATGPQSATTAQTTLPTVSVTRDWNYASGGAGSSNTSVGHDAILVLDRNAVESNFKTLGTSQSQDVRGQAYTKKQQVSRYNMMSKYKTDDPEQQKDIDTRFHAPKAGGEFEEAVVVPKGSLPLKGTMVGFWVNPKSQLTKDPEVMNDPRRLELAPGGTGRFVKANKEPDQQQIPMTFAQKQAQHLAGQQRSKELGTAFKQAKKGDAASYMDLPDNQKRRIPTPQGVAEKMKMGATIEPIEESVDYLDEK